MVTTLHSTQSQFKFFYYCININASKTNVFISLTSLTSGQLFVLKTPGLLLRENILRSEYQRLSSKTQKRKKKNLRLYTNTRKRTKTAALHALKAFLKHPKFRELSRLKNVFYLLNLFGSNLWMSKKIAVSLLKSNVFSNWWGLRIPQGFPHNGTKLKIKKRKKNKGLNKAIKAL